MYQGHVLDYSFLAFVQASGGKPLDFSSRSREVHRALGYGS